jgi:hypothetical protein
MKDTPLSTKTSRRELDARVADGIQVRLLWYPSTNRVAVEVFDAASGESFEFDVPADSALDAFHHPYAYLAPAAPYVPAQQAA